MITNGFFDYAGITVLENLGSEKKVELGIKVSMQGGKAIVSRVVRGKSGHVAGINVKDEVVAVDGYRMTSEKLKKLVSMKQPGDKMEVLISRDGMLKTIPVELRKSTRIRYELMRKENRTEQQDVVYNKWLSSPR